MLLVLTGPCCCTVPAAQTVRSFTCPTFFFFHVGNAFESADGSSLHVDLAAYDDPQILLDLGLDPLRQPRKDGAGALQQQVSTSSYRRLTIPLQGQSGGRLQVGKFCRA
jgi:carotenoid cleavage dioxygenase-like enzyme